MKMNALKVGGALALSLFLVACGEKQSAELESGRVSDPGPTASKAGASYSGAGEVTGTTGDQITISHGPIEGIGWPAMTMSFGAEPGQLAGLKPGDRVAFSFRQDGRRSVITSIAKQQP